MSSALRKELLDALRARFAPLVRDADLSNCNAAFCGGTRVYRTVQLYRFFDLSRVDVSSEGGVKSQLDTDFVESIKLLEVTPPEELRLFEIYPLLRRTMILIEGFLGHVSASKRFEGSLAHGRGLSLPDPSLYLVLDELYDQVSGNSINRDRLLAGLGTLVAAGGGGLDSVLLSASTFANLMVPVIANSFDKYGDDLLESSLATFTFGALQRLSALFLLMVVVDQSAGSASARSRGRTEPLLTLSGDDASDDNMFRLQFLCNETLLKPLVNKVADHHLGVCWNEDVVSPVLSMLQFTFVECGKVVARSEALADLVIATTKGFLMKVPDDCSPSRTTLDLILGFGHQLLGMFYQGVELVNVALWYHFESRLSHVLKLQQQATPKITGSPTLTPDDRNIHIGIGSINSSPRLPSSGESSPYRPLGRSLNTLLSEGELKSTLLAFLASLDYYARHQDSLFDVLSGNYTRKADVELLDCLSRLFVHYTCLVQLGDAVAYITQRSPNAEVGELVKQAISMLWATLCSLGSRVSFNALRACFYYLGSSLHSRNVAAQICCFNAISHNQADMRQWFDLPKEAYAFRVEMLRAVLRNASSACCTCVSYGPSKTRRFGSQYLSISSTFVSRWFITEILSYEVSENRGLVDAFIEWCNSSRPEEYMLCRFLCRVLARLCAEDNAVIDGGRYILDVLLGICMHQDHASRGLKSVMHPLSNGRINAFRCLGMLLSTGVFTDWILRHVLLPYTCAFTKQVGQYVSKCLGASVAANQLSFDCYFATQGSVCKCLDAPIVSHSAGLVQYLELVSSLPLDKHDPNGKDETSRVVSHVLGVLCGLLRNLATLLNTHRESADIDSRFALFILCVRLAGVLVRAGQFGRKDTEAIVLLKLYALLGNPRICVVEEVDLYLSLIMEALCAFHAIFDHVPVKDQLLQLHRGFLVLLLSKIDTHPKFFLRHELYIGVPRPMFDQFCNAFADILRKASSMGHYLGSLYSFRIWSVLRRYGVDCSDVKKEYAEQALNEQDVPAEARITFNTAFMVSCRLPAIASATVPSSVRALVEQGSAVGLYSKS
ncbi:Crp Fnr family transcription regulator, putative [Babesia ovata]|uniref:Crp Fnr family transcription regulator, putative n=1 Tax=Babesia ovata TaxID=189622 RepID=A0A2H6K8L3_9APIC|nr:Crp Fnr family transcription regulator, putative [Babesia ovata]GBE59334.1 Crp Fnr family transcription regulator, putative [Babesia ovata]